MILDHLSTILDTVRGTGTCHLWSRNRVAHLVVVAKRNGLALELLENRRGSVVRKLLQLERAEKDFQVDWTDQGASESARDRFIKYPLHVVAIYAGGYVKGLAMMDDRSFQSVIWLGFDAVIKNLPTADLGRRADVLGPAFFDLLDRVVAVHSRVPVKAHTYATDVASIIPKFPTSVLTTHMDRIVRLLRPLYDIDSDIHSRTHGVRSVIGGPLASHYIHLAIAKLPIASLVPWQPILVLHFTVLTWYTHSNRPTFKAAINADTFITTMNKLARSRRRDHSHPPSRRPPVVGLNPILGPRSSNPSSRRVSVSRR